MFRSLMDWASEVSQSVTGRPAQDPERSEDAPSDRASLSDADFLELRDRSGTLESETTPNSLHSGRQSIESLANNNTRRKSLSASLASLSPESYHRNNTSRRGSSGDRDSVINLHVPVYVESGRRASSPGSVMDSRRGTPTRANGTSPPPLRMIDVSEGILADMAEINEARHKRHRRASPHLRTSPRTSPHATPRPERESEGDGFPWPRKASQPSNVLPPGSHPGAAAAAAAVVATEVDMTSVTGDDVRSQVSRDGLGGAGSRRRRSRSSRCCRFPWMIRLMRVLRDNKAETEEEALRLRQLDRDQAKHFRMVKRVLNMLFLTLGIILLLAVIVLIIYTDSQFNESMKALTVFIAGRRQGLW